MSQHVIYDEKIFVRDLPSERYVNGRKALANFSPKDGTYRDFSALKEHLRIDWKIMVEDVVAEGKGEFVDTKEARQAISKRAAVLFHAHLKKIT